MSESNKNIYVLDKEKKDTAGAIRKMAAIFAADVVGYSKLMASNEKLTLFRLKETRKITDKIIHELNGRIFSTAGDSIMAEFASPVDAMEAAISIQKEVSKKAKEIQDNITIEFRIGINLGDIMTQDNNLYGDNVNIAARLEAIAPVGEITVSEKVYLEVEDKVDISFKYQGEKKLKNISKKIKVYTSQMTTDKKKSVKFQKKPYIITAIIALFIVVGSVFYFLNNKSSNDIEYTDNSKSVLESFRTDQESLPNNNNASSNIVFVALMEFQNQSKILTGQEIENISKLFSEKLFEEEKISIVKTPQGSENLNPPEVMLIATESNASFVVNGIISDENNSSFLNLKIYEAKRGSLIINQKISIDENNGNLIDFTSNFKKDILKK
jgi:class 3 adenylate cyclase